jgi:hypothetical protein
LNTRNKIIGVRERQAAAVAAMQTVWVSVGMKDVSIESFLSNFLFIGSESELQILGRGK